MPPTIRDEQGLPYYRQDPYRDALGSFEPIYSADEGEIRIPATYQPLPTLQVTEPTQADARLYQLLQAAHRSTELQQKVQEIQSRVQDASSSDDYVRADPEYLNYVDELDRLQQTFQPYYQRYGLPQEEATPTQAIRQAILGGELHPGIASYSDPGLQAYVNNLVSDAGRTDAFSVLGDQLIPALALFGVAAGGAALSGGFAAEGGAGAGVAAGAPASSVAPIAATPTTLAPSGAFVPSVAGGATVAGGGGAALAGGAPAAGITPVAATPATLAPGAATITGGTAAATTAGAGGGLLGTIGKLAPIVGPLVSAGGAIAGGIIGGNAAKDAADTQAEAAAEANELLRDVYTQQRTDQAPFLAAGTQAIQDLQNFPTFDPSGSFYTPTAPLDPGAYLYEAAPTYTPPAVYEQAPYEAPTAETLLKDPSYKFRVGEGQKVLERSAAARGQALSGGTLKALTNYGQEAASQEYGAAFTRGLTLDQLKYERGSAANQQNYARSSEAERLNEERRRQANELAYGRALTATTDQYGRDLRDNELRYNRTLQGYGVNLGRLQSLAGVGQTSVGQLSSLGANIGGQQAANVTSAGAAQAAGRIGAANAVNDALSGTGKAAQSYLDYSLLSELVRRKEPRYAT